MLRAWLASSECSHFIALIVSQKTMKQAALLNKVANSIHSQIGMYYYSSSFTRVKKRKTPKKTPQIAQIAYDSKKQPQNK